MNCLLSIIALATFSTSAAPTSSIRIGECAIVVIDDRTIHLTSTTTVGHGFRQR